MPYLDPSKRVFIIVLHADVYCSEGGGLMVVPVCVCGKERLGESACVCLCLRVCECVRVEKEREREKEGKRTPGWRRRQSG